MHRLQAGFPVSQALWPHMLELIAASLSRGCEMSIVVS